MQNLSVSFWSLINIPTGNAHSINIVLIDYRRKASFAKATMNTREKGENRYGEAYAVSLFASAKTCFEGNILL